MRYLRAVAAVLLVGACGVPCASAAAAGRSAPNAQEYIDEPLPPGFQVVISELEGPVFANEAGRTMYTWPMQSMRNGVPGEPAGTPGCYDVKYRTAAGYKSPYPAEGFELPDADARRTCVQNWPPVYASADAKPIGNFTILDRTDGTKQWGYEGYALYTSHMDTMPGQTNGGTGRNGWSQNVERVPSGPAPLVPTQFKVATMTTGRMLTTVDHESIYAFDGDTATSVKCVDACLDDWVPMLASQAVVPQGPWAFVTRPNGERQWTYRGMPLYTHSADTKLESFEGSDVPGWHNVFMQRAPNPPKGFHTVDTRAGEVLADPQGRTIYLYSCHEDAPDVLLCDTPDSTQEYRWAVCGGFDRQRCLSTFPYVIADANAKSDNVSWSVIYIDPMTGRIAKREDPGALRVWAFRGRPIYTTSMDKEIGDIQGDSWGQDHGSTNGFKALWIRDDFRHNDGTQDYKPF